MAPRPRPAARGRYGPTAKPEQRARNALYLAEFFARSGVDHVHVHFANRAAHTAVFLKEISGISFGVTAHGQDFMQRSRQRRFATRDLRRSGIRRSGNRLQPRPARPALSQFRGENSQGLQWHRSRTFSGAPLLQR